MESKSYFRMINLENGVVSEKCPYAQYSFLMHNIEKAPIVESPNGHQIHQDVKNE